MEFLLHDGRHLVVLQFYAREEFDIESGRSHLSKRQKDRIQAIQERRRERANLKQNINDDDLQNLSQLGSETIGTVVTNYGSQVDIEGTKALFDGKIVRCHKRANMETLVTGDKVIWRPADPHGVVVALQPRETELIRPDIYGKLRPVAANIDRIANEGAMFTDWYAQ